VSLQAERALESDVAPGQPAAIGAFGAALDDALAMTSPASNPLAVDARGGSTRGG
jgi:hypothetical protein